MYLPLRGVHQRVPGARPMHPIIRESFLQRYETFCAELAKCRVHPSLDAVHDLRVSIRRMNAVLAKIEQFDPTIMVHRCAAELKTLMKPLGKLRDLHVQVEWVEKTFRIIGPGLNEYLKKLWARERRLRKKILSITADFTPTACAALHGEIQALAGPVDEERFLGISRRIMDELYASLAGMRETVSAANNAEALHAMRISLKKYRYTAEILKPALGRGSSAVLKRMHALQTVLGDIHDFDVLIARLGRFAREKDRTKYEIGNLRNSLRRLRRMRREMNAGLLGSIDAQLAAIEPALLGPGGDDEREEQTQG